MLNGFGFSAGDFIAGVKLIIDLLQAFKQRSGAVEKHAAQVAYLDCLNLTIDRLDKYTDETPTDEAVIRWMEQLKEPLAAFKTYLDQYQALKPDVEASFAAKQWAKVALTVDEVNEKIDKLRVQIVEPLPSINLLLSLQIIKSLNKPLQPEQCKRIADELLAAGLRADLDRQVAEVQRAAADDQLATQANEILEIKTLVKNIEQRVKLVSSSTTTWDTRKRVIDLATDLQKMQAGIAALRNYFETDGFEVMEAPQDYEIARGRDQRDDWDQRRCQARSNSRWSAAVPVVTNLAGMMLSAVVAGLIASMTAEQGQARRSLSPLPPPYRQSSRAAEVSTINGDELSGDEDITPQEEHKLQLEAPQLEI